MAIIINGSNTPTAGAVACGNGTELAFSDAGTKGQVLISNITSAPSWSTILTADDLNYGVGVGASVDGSALLSIGAGDASKAPLKFASGTVTTVAVAGEMEYDGTNLLFTQDDTSRRGFVANSQIYRLTANGAAIGPTIANYFGATSALNVPASAAFDLEFYLYFLKTTAGTATFTITTTQAPVSLSGVLYTGAIAGGTAFGAANVAAVFNSTSTSASFAATGSLTTGVNHAVQIRATFEGNATPGTVRLSVTQSAGTITPLRGSYFKATRLPSGNSGNFT